MTGPDPFQEGRERAEARRREMEALREDVRAIVREEVGRAGMSEGELEGLVRRLVRAEVAASTSAGGGRSARVPLMAAAGVAVGVLAGVLGYRALTTDSGDAGRATAAVVAPGEGVAAAEDGTGATAGTVAGEGARASTALPPEGKAALWDSLFAARHPRLEPFVSRLESAGPAAPVRAAIGLWRSGEPLDQAARRRLHDALVQLALNEVAGAGLSLDGLVTRGPCRGNSCGALLSLWQAQGEALGLPPFPANAASDGAALGTAERVLVLGRVEAPGA